MADVVLKRHCKLLSFFTIIKYNSAFSRRLIAWFLPFRYCSIPSIARPPTCFSENNKWLLNSICIDLFMESTYLLILPAFWHAVFTIFIPYQAYRISLSPVHLCSSGNSSLGLESSRDSNFGDICLALGLSLAAINGINSSWTHLLIVVLSTQGFCVL